MAYGGRMSEEMNINVQGLIHRYLLPLIPTPERLQSLGYPSEPDAHGNVTIVERCYERAMSSKPNEKECCRCRQAFMGDMNNYSLEPCRFHKGKPRRQAYGWTFMSCCGENPASPGCSQAARHVWTGFNPGMNMYGNFLKTTGNSTIAPFSIFAIDCEMGYTIAGMEVIRVTLVDLREKVVFDSLVRPQCPLIDYNTEYSGISQRDFLSRPSLSFDEARQQLLNIIKSDTILIGHGLENDLRVLKISHFQVVDTVIVYPHPRGYPFRRALRDIALEVLSLHIQTGTGVNGHDSIEDATTCVKLVLHILKTRYNIALAPLE